MSEANVDGYVIYTCWRPQDRRPVRHVYGHYPTQHQALVARRELTTRLLREGVEIKNLDTSILRVLNPERAPQKSIQTADRHA